jgi:catabolite regulation protein CreA
MASFITTTTERKAEKKTSHLFKAVAVRRRIYFLERNTFLYLRILLRNVSLS